MNSAVIILYFNKINMTSECINSVIDAGIPMSQIFAFSNGSDKIFHKELKNRFPSIGHNHIEINSGFSGGFNNSLKWIFSLGFTSALFLTNDTIMGKNALDECIITSSETGSGFIAPAIHSFRKPEKIDSCSGYFDRERLTLSHYHSTDLPLYLNPDDYIPGTALFISADVFKNTGGMDESFHTYWDDVDLSFRAHKSDIKQARCFKADIYHKVGQTCHKKPLYTTFYFQRNKILFCKKHLHGEKLNIALRKISIEIDILFDKANSDNNTQKQKYIEEIKLLLE